MFNFLASILFILPKKVNKIFINFWLNAFVNIILGMFALECNIEELNQSIVQSTLFHDFIVIKACVTEFNIDINFNKYFVKRW
jgi:hypothetical protein